MLLVLEVQKIWGAGRDWYTATCVITAQPADAALAPTLLHNNVIQACARAYLLLINYDT